MALEGLSSDYETLTDPMPDRPNLLVWTCVVLAALFAALLFSIVLFGDPRADRPSVDLAIDPIVRTNMPSAGWSHGVHSPKPGSVEDKRQHLAQLPDTVEQPESGQKARQIIRPIYAGSSLVADPALVESTPFGPLPRIADDGRTPVKVYGGSAPAVGKKFRIAIVMLGFGASGDATTAALAGLPTEVTVGFVPRGGDIQNWVNEARSRGHEVLLELPMEPYDYPDSDPGPPHLAHRPGRRGQHPSSHLGAHPLHRLCGRDQRTGRPLPFRFRGAGAGDDLSRPPRVAVL